MSRTSLAVWLATPALLACAGLASAYTYPPSEYTWGCNNGRSFGANITAFFNQHGPLFNYGPYYGYPPFDPYGPWNAYLQYNPWYYGSGYGRGCGGGGCIDRDLSGHGPCCAGGPSWHSSWSQGGWFHGCSTCCSGGIFTGHGGMFHKPAAAPCSTCPITGSVPAIGATPKAAFVPGIDPVTRCAGVGHPAEFAAFYEGLPTLDLSVAK